MQPYSRKLISNSCRHNDTILESRVSYDRWPLTIEFILYVLTPCLHEFSALFLNPTFKFSWWPPLLVVIHIVFIHPAQKIIGQGLGILLDCFIILEISFGDVNE
jgi:hypothetical protein